jgi:hypothetical protein
MVVTGTSVDRDRTGAASSTASEYGKKNLKNISAADRAVKGCTDTFDDRRRPGRVVGTVAAGGVRRDGIDVERVMSIDNRALRIQPLIKPGWGRAGIHYGPHERQSGLAFAVFLVNGHNTSQSENLTETFRERVWRWSVGSEAWRARQRAFQWLRSKRKSRLIRELLWWRRIQKDAPPVPRMDENLALGWFSCPVPEDPLKDGNAFIMHATGPENGELWARTGSHCQRTVRSVQNLQIYYVVILREKGAAYYATSVPNANGLGAYPNLRPLAIDAFNDSTPVYPGLYQSLLGQIGFRLDTRVYGARVEHLAELSGWYGTAHAADRLEGSGELRRSEAEVGGIWRMCEDGFQRSPEGAVALDGGAAIVDPGKPSGLIHVVWQAGSHGTAGLVCRHRDNDNYWRFVAADQGCRAAIKLDGTWHEVAATDKRIDMAGTRSIQVLDDGSKIGFYLQGELLFDAWIADPRLADATGVGIAASGPAVLHSFEAHPRSIPLPKALDMGAPWLRKGEETIVADNFNGAAGDLAGTVTDIGRKVWDRAIGRGRMERTGDGAVKICATAERPNPGRTAYMIDWDYPEFADVEVNITPPGNAKGQREHGLCGFILWQDDDNYITVNIWRSDGYGGASISCFFHLDGFEDLYDAIWSNVGDRVYYGIPLDLRMSFDGMNYMIFVNDEPVLYRALTDVYPDCRRFSINRLGLLANWEWGNDTGSVFRKFTGRI